MSPFQYLFFLLTTALAVDRTVNPELNAKLKLAATTLDRHSELPSDSDWTFSFPDQPNYTFSPGSVVNANAATFPALTGIGMTLALLNLGPCAMLAPHLHPRGTNLVVAVVGNTTSYMINENGVRTVEVQLTPGVMTIFPNGALHGMQNNGCENAQLVSALNSEDSGTLNIMNGLYEMPQDIIKAAFGFQGESLDVQGLGEKIPGVGTGSVMGSEACIARCGIKPGE